jgi:transcriptional regulator with XRE-family HTH domain
MTRNSAERMTAIGADEPIPASTVVAIRLRELRQLRNLNGKQFAARCAELGATGITSHVVTNVEIGRREVTVDDLLLFALVLDVPPAELLTPAPERPLTVAVTAQMTVADRTVLSRWICGGQALPASDEGLYTSYVASRMPAPARAVPSADAAAEWQAAAGRLLIQFDNQLTDVAQRLRGEFSAALDDLAAGISHGTGDEVAHAIEEARRRLNPAEEPPPA